MAEKTIEQASTVSWVMQRAQQACLLLIVSRRIRGRAARTNPCGMFATVGGWQLTLIFSLPVSTAPLNLYTKLTTNDCFALFCFV